MFPLYEYVIKCPIIILCMVFLYYLGIVYNKKFLQFFEILLKNFTDGQNYNLQKDRQNCKSVLSLSCPALSCPVLLVPDRTGQDRVAVLKSKTGQRTGQIAKIGKKTLPSCTMYLTGVGPNGFLFSESEFGFLCSLFGMTQNLGIFGIPSHP